MSDSVIEGMPSDIFYREHRGRHYISVEPNAHHQAINKLFTTDLTHFELLAPHAGCRLILKGITITGAGNQGVVKVCRSKDGSCIMPAYFSAQVKGSPSSAFNFIMDIDEKVWIDTTTRNGNETFVGISYIEYPS